MCGAGWGLKVKPGELADLIADTLVANRIVVVHTATAASQWDKSWTMPMIAPPGWKKAARFYTC
jgi:hypothetical protein